LVVDNDPQVFVSLMCALLVQARSRSADYVLIGLPETDPLWPLARSLGGTCYTTHLFIVCWEDGEAEFRGLDRKIPYLELGSL
jgi:hypothetical protein